MEQEELDVLYDKVYEKLKGEQEKFEEWWYAQPKDVHNREAYRYAMQEDILLAAWSMELSEEQCRVILSKKEPLREMFNEYMGYETDHMDYIRSAVEDAIETVSCDVQAELARFRNGEN